MATSHNTQEGVIRFLVPLCASLIHIPFGNDPFDGVEINWSFGPTTLLLGKASCCGLLAGGKTGGLPISTGLWGAAPPGILENLKINVRLRYKAIFTIKHSP